MITRKAGIFLVLAVIVVLAAVTLSTNNVETTTQGTQVATTFYPLYSLTKSIVGEQGQVYSIVPAGVEPHSYEPVPSDFQKLSDADAFITLGIEFEEFEEDLAESVNTQVSIIPAGNNIVLIDISEDEHHEEEKSHDELHEEGTEHDHEEESHEDEHEDHEEEGESHEDEHHEEEEEEHHHHSGQDPHIWLSPRNAQDMATNIMNGLVEADPANEEQYRQNTQALLTELQALDEAFSQELANCAKDTILVNHNAFSYLARDYGFTTIEIAGLEPEVEPTPQQLAKLVDEAKEHDLKYVFYEELVDSRVAETIANEVGAEVLPLSPIASDLDISYTDLMRENLDNLKIALEC